ncbi:PKD domain-containing protein [Algoriphagus pacificus]|uniref:Gliding motility-associated C-terminal domain-containing protein n=1 Tax=Algoriphagus pacificus TaxID=2811234 RepID=A0ABS3CE08_9BACT|nr:PKD domain-containing protein [Algoriphagus pacificus]MBN7815346.1 gliding motility-associated C-terminal domain-containing protein [Algoriphagus pacificus]
MRRTVFILFNSIFLFLLVGIAAPAQVLPDTKEVNQFYIGFMDNFLPGAPFEPTLIITALEENVEGRIEFGGNTVPFSLGLGEVFEFEANPNLVIQTNQVVENKGVYVYAEGEVSVYALDLKPGTFDGTLVLPHDQLGSNYFAASHYENQTKGIRLSERQFNNESQILIVGTKDGTQIQITPTAPVNNSLSPFTITLNQGQTYQFKSKGDLTGTEISVINSTEDCARIAVFSGNKFADIGDPECGPFSTSHIYNQNEPVSSWGTEFFHIPLKDRQLGELVKFIAAFDNTEVFEGGNLLASLNSGEFFTLDVESDRALHFTSSKPIGVFGFGKSYSCEILDENSVLSPANVDNYGNPQMVNYAPFNNPKRQITVNFHKVYGTFLHYAQLVTRTEDFAQMQIDGAVVSNQFEPFDNNPDFSYAQIILAPGIHTLSNPAGFSGYFYAVGASQSYALDFGKDFENNEYEILSSFDDLKTGSPRIACIDQEGTWEVIPDDPSYTYFYWDFGDETGIKVGQLVLHTYTEPGTFTVKAFASIDASGCEETELHEFEVEVTELSGELEGPLSSCPNVEELSYFFEGEGEISEVQWEAIGGEIISQTNEEAIVKWGEANPNAIIRAIPIGDNGCPGKPVELEVLIKRELEPEMAIGPDFICDLSLEYTYTVNQIIPNRNYEWEVVRGEFIGGNIGSEIIVKWDENESQGILRYWEFSTLDEFCEGTSPDLTVALNTGFEASIFEQSNVTCFGAADGEISLEIVGGIQPYTFSWSHDPSLNSETASNLVSGVYSVIIQDSQGCEISLENLEIIEPEPLEASILSQQDPSCFGNTDGSLAFEIQGGTPPYRLADPQIPVDQNQVSLENLEGGTYAFTILDSNDCETELNLTLNEPDPLEVVFTVNRNPCPGDTNGEIMAELRGGTGPFTYEWSNGASTQVNQGVAGGEYEVQVRDAAGCVGVGNIRLQEVAPRFRFPTGFNPEQGPFGPIADCGEVVYTLIIFNRWGQLIYSGNSPWDGNLNGKNSPTGTYTFRFDYEFSLNDESVLESQSGSFLKVN